MGPDEVTASDTPVSRVSVKPPPFYRQSPSIWFRQMESQFALAQITQKQTKFHHILAALPEDVALNLPTDLTEDYDEIKESVVKLYTKSKSELIEEALGDATLQGQKPSFFYRHLSRKLSEIGIAADEDLMKHKLLNAVPIEVKSALIGHMNLDGTDFAALADTIVQMTDHKGRPTVSAVPNSKYPQNKAANTRANAQQTDVPFGIAPFAEGQRPKICRFHLYYANDAKRCKPWCKWPGRKPSITDASSRPSSPGLSGNAQSLQ